MDSMKSLNTSLPSSTPPQPPEQLLQSFKTAALSVTHLYKNAVYEQSQAKQAGYQEAIEELLQFLDKQNLGLGDGEGWKVRQWATERNDGMGAPPSDEDDQADSEKRARSSTPATVRKDREAGTAGPAAEPSRSASPPKDERQSAPPSQHVNDGNSVGKPAIFTFTSGPTLPQEQEVDMHTDNPPTAPHDDSGVSVPVMPRGSRPHHRHGNLPRPNPRTPSREPSVGIGSKRKLTFPDFFDLSGVTHARDMFGGGKRGRYS